MSRNLRNVDIDRAKKASFIKVRFIIVVLATLCPVVCYISRQNLSIAIVAMVKDKNKTEISNQTQANIHNISNGDDINKNQTQSTSISNLETCPAPTILDADGNEISAPEIISYGPKYEWEESQKSFIFQAFFWTYVICQIPAARFAEIVGAKWILVTATVGSSVLSLISPWAASIHPYALALVRAYMGVCQTALYPACYVLYTRWLPPAERSQAIPVLGAGAYIGSIITSTATGYFSEQKSLGWEYAFYFPSVVCAIWAILWIFLGTSEPKQHWLISVEEIDYIESKMEVKRTSFQQSKKDISWMKILTSQHIWAMATAFLASNWAFTITLIYIPSYLNYILLIPPFKNGVINSIIYILFCISSPIVGVISAFMIQTRPFGLTNLQIRKIFQSIAVFSQAICFILLPFIGCNTNFVLVILYTQIVLYSFVNGGEVQVPAELSLDFAGTIYAIGNCVGSSTGILVPEVHKLIVKNHHDRGDWNTYFYFAAVVTTLGGLVFLIFGKNDLQDFSKDVGESQVDIYTLSSGREFNSENIQDGKKDEKLKKRDRVITNS